MMKPNRLEGDRGQHQKCQHPPRMKNMQRHEQAGGGEDNQAEDD